MIDRACISLNSNCNLKCKYCHFRDKQKDYESFSIKEVKIIVDNIHNYCETNEIQKFKLGIVGSGEPMLKADIMLDLLDYVKKSNYVELNIYTITNGTLLTIDLLNKFVKFKNFFKISISLDGYAKLHNLGRSAYDKVVEGIKNYRCVFGESPSINATVNLESYKNKEKLIDYYKSMGLYEVTFSKLVGYQGKDLYITQEKYDEFMNYAYLSGMKSRQFRKEKCYDCTMYGKLCGVGRTNIFITPDGIYPCGRFYKNKKYFLGSYDADLSVVENMVKKMTPVEEGKCYFIENVEGGIK